MQECRPRSSDERRSRQRALVLPDGLVVAAMAAVNALGDVIDPATGQVVAGVRIADGRGLADARALLRSGAPLAAFSGANSTIGVIATNARLSKTQATKIAQMAHDGYARAIAPIHTMADGDTGVHAGDRRLGRHARGVPHRRPRR